MSTYKRTESSFMEVTMEPFEPLKILYHFPRLHEEEVNKIIASKPGSITLEILLRNIHANFKDSGLRSTLIHQVFSSSEHDIEHYVP